MRIAIAGAGIGGLATALSLSRDGHEVVLLESRTGFDPEGAGIQLSPNAGRVLSGLGLDRALARVSSEPERIVIRSFRSGRGIGGAALGAAVRARFGAPYRVVLRADLQTVLLDAVRSRPNIRLLLGRSVRRVEPRPGSVGIVAEKGPARGEESHEAEILVGADGFASRCRALLGDRRPLAPARWVAWRTLLTDPSGPAAAAVARNETGLWLGPGAHLVHYPVAAGQTLNIVLVERRAAASGQSGPAALARAGRDLSELLAAARDWRPYDLHDLPVSRMATGRVALVGDAAHPVLPTLAQGGALAIEDAAVLAHRVRTTGDVPAALRLYGSDRLDRVRRVQRAARGNAASFHAGAAVALVRDAVIRRLGPDGMTERYAWLYGWRPPGSGAD